MSKLLSIKRTSNKRQRLASLLFTVLIAQSCEQPQGEEPGFGLKVASLSIASEDLGKLNGSVYAKAKVPAHLSLDGEHFLIDVAYAGQGTLDDYKKSLQFEVKSRGKTIKGHREYRLSSQSVDETALKSLFGFQLFRQAGIATPEIEPVALYLNGRYQGLYFLIENVKKTFFKRRGINAIRLHKAKLSHGTFAEDTALGMEFKMPAIFKPERYDHLIKLIATINREPEKLDDFVDLSNYARYLAIAVLLQHGDGIVNNFYIYLDAKDYKFKFVPWDLDRIMETKIGPDRDPLAMLPERSQLAEKILTNPSFAAVLNQQLLQTLADNPKANLGDELTNFGTKIAEAFRHDPVLSKDGMTAEKRVAEFIDRLNPWYDGLKKSVGQVTQ